MEFYYKIVYVLHTTSNLSLTCEEEYSMRISLSTLPEDLLQIFSPLH